MTGQLRAGRCAASRIGRTGAGRFRHMFLAQIPQVTGFHLARLCDLYRYRAARAATAWSAVAIPAHLPDDARRLLDEYDLDVLVETTGDPAAAIRHALDVFERRCTSST